ncbi:MAG TPA: hypothetical protein VFO90_08375 [Terrimicrobiaceae bacterium]|nr:hypothetical protein [Terrimicrobiaceae bacterium]
MKSVLAIFLAVLFAGCSATTDLASFEAASSEKALVRWYRKGISLLYDGVCARSANGAVLVRLYKQSPAPLAEFRIDPEDYFVARGRLAGRGWAGPAPDAPAKFSSWVAFLKAYRASAGISAGSRQVQTDEMRIVSTKSDGKLRTLNVSNTRTGEVISAVLN